MTSPTASELNQGKELLPCPFCGAPAQISTEHGRDSSTTTVHCSCCGNAGFEFEWLGDEAEAGANAIERWNRRSSEAPSRRGEGDKPMPFKLPVEKRKTDYGFVIVNATGGYICELGDEADADAIVEALNKNTGAS